VIGKEIEIIMNKVKDHLAVMTEIIMERITIPDPILRMKGVVMERSHITDLILDQIFKEVRMETEDQTINITLVHQTSPHQVTIIPGGEIPRQFQKI